MAQVWKRQKRKTEGDRRLLERLGGSEAESGLVEQELLSRGPDAAREILAMLRIAPPQLEAGDSRIQNIGIGIGAGFALLISSQHLWPRPGASFGMIVVVLLVAAAAYWQHTQRQQVSDAAPDVVQRGQRAAVRALAKIEEPRAVGLLLEALSWSPGYFGSVSAVREWQVEMANAARDAARTALIRLLPRLQAADVAWLDTDTMQQIVQAGGIRRATLGGKGEIEEKKPARDPDDLNLLAALVETWEHLGVTGIPLLLEAMEEQEAVVRLAAASALARLLADYLTPEKAFVLLTQQRTMLRRLLKEDLHWAVEGLENAAPQITLLDALALGSDMEWLAQAERIAQQRPNSKGAYLLRNAALERLPAIRERAARQQERATLVRPAQGVSGIDPAQMLRPAQGASLPEEAQLFHADSPDDGATS